MIVASIIFVGLFAAAGANPFMHWGCKGPHESFQECYNECARPRCGAAVDFPCQPTCNKGCFCEEGYFRNPEGICVIEECHHHRRHWRCGPNEKFRKCRHTCEPTCHHPHRPRDCSTESACLDFGCQCRHGFVRNKHGRCIPYDMCPNKRDVCGKNEKWTNSTNVPEAKCQKPRCDNQKFPKDCPRYTTNGGCVCKTGYVRTNRGKCVKEKDCDRSHHHSHSHHDWDDDWDDWSDSWDDDWDDDDWDDWDDWDDCDDDDWDCGYRRRHHHRRHHRRHKRGQKEVDQGTNSLKDLGESEQRDGTKTK